MNIFVSLSLLAGLAAQSPATPDTVHLVVAATTDVHGRVYHWDYVRDEEAPFGLTRAGTVIDSLREAYPGRVILVDAGDLIQGNPFAAFYAEERTVDLHPVVDGLNAVGYDAATPGNHEFNWGLDTFARARRAAAFPMVSANIYGLPRNTLALPPFVLLPRGGVRVGITGFTTPGTMVWDRAHVAGRLVVRPILPEAGRVLRDLRDVGADLRLVLMHSGMDGRSSYDTSGVGAEHVAAELAQLPVKPHVVVVGHSHRTMADSVIDGVHYIQPPPHARGLAVAHVWLIRGKEGRSENWVGQTVRSGPVGTYQVIRVTSETIQLADVPPHPVVSRRLALAHETVRRWVTQPVAQVVEGNWRASYGRVEDTPVIDFVNEVQRRVAGTDLSATAVFDPRAGFGPGEVRLRDVAGLYPYENTLRAVRIDGTTLRAYLERSAEYFHTYRPGAVVINESVPGFNFDILSGVEYVLDLTLPEGARVRQLTVRGRMVEPTDTFTLALNSYRQGGGGGFEMLEGLPVIYDGPEIQGLLVDHLRAVRFLRASDYYTPSWRIIPAEAAVAARAAFGSPAPIADAPPRAAVSDTIAPSDPERPLAYGAQARSGSPLARVKLPLEARGSQHALGRLIADAYRAAARAHVGLVPSARIVAGLPAGLIHRGHVEAVLSQPSALVRFAMTGRLLRQLVEYALTGEYPVVHLSGIVVHYDPRRSPGRRVRELRLSDGSEIRERERFDLVVPTLLVSDAGGLAIPTAGGTWLVLEAIDGTTTDVSEVDALVSYLQALPQPVEGPPTPRFRIRR